MVTPGFQTTVQDLGRFGYAHLGVSASGAADALALRAANLLAGNAENAPALEMTLTGGAFEFETDAVIALAGSDFGSGLPMWSAVSIPAGAVVRCGPARTGARCYLAVRGGIAIPKTLGSASTHILTGLGGRVLRAGDVLPMGEAAVRKPRWAACGAPEYTRAPVLRVTAGPQADWFSGELYQAAYLVTEESNRMGLRLSGTPIPSPSGYMPAEGVTLGAVQIPPAASRLFCSSSTRPPAAIPSLPMRSPPISGAWANSVRATKCVSNRSAWDRALSLLREQEQWLYSLL